MFDLDRLAAFERGLTGDRPAEAPLALVPQVSRNCPASVQPVAAVRGCPFGHGVKPMEEVAA